VAQQNRSDGSYEEHRKVSIERNSIEDSLVGGDSKTSSLVDEETSKNEGIKHLEHLHYKKDEGIWRHQKAMEISKDEEIKLLKHQLYEKDEGIRRHQKAMETSKDEEIKLLKHQLYEKDEEIRRHQKAMKTICSDLKFALEAAKELRQQENPWLNESITDFMFYNLENAYATAQFGERNPPYSWRGNWDLVGAVMS
jgi:hypothetical protein